LEVLEGFVPSWTTLAMAEVKAAESNRSTGILTQL